jgi:glycosyltransferase involved in cell wall biosynthesis
MKIAYLIPGCKVSGGVAVVCQHANRLFRRGHDVVLISETNERTIDWFPNHKVPIIGLADIPQDLDILVATAWLTAFRIAGLPARYKFYFVQSDETRFHPKNSPWEHITRLSYAIDYNYLTEARWIRQWLMDGFDHHAELVPNGLDSEIFYPSEPLEPKGSKPRILLEGAIGLAYKGMAEAFEAIKDIDAEVWCVSSYGRPEKSWKCHRFFEQIPITEMRRVYSSCDILLKLSRVEGFFGPPMEMMACGGTVVVGKVTGYDEYIEHEKNALVVDPLNPQEAATAVQRLIDDTDLRQRLIENGRRTADLWRWESSIDILEQYFQDVSHGVRGVAATADRNHLARSVAFFYSNLQGIDLEEFLQPPKAKAPQQDQLEAGSAKKTKANPFKRPAHQGSAHMLELGATEKLLAWLRGRRMFRKMAVLVVHYHNIYKYYFGGNP